MSGDRQSETELTYGQDETQDFVDRSVIDFDPADGLYTGTAVTGESDIPGPSEAEIREAQEDEANAGSAQSSGGTGDDS